MNKEHTENYKHYYDWLPQHVRLHLASRRAKAENLVNIQDDTLTVSLMNLVALQWLRKCHPNLNETIQNEYSTELRKGEELASVAPSIAPNIDSLIARYQAAIV